MIKRFMHRPFLMIGVFLVIGLSVAGFASEINWDDAVVIDVRTQAEWNEGHLDDALLIPWRNIVAGVQAQGLDKDEPIGLYCEQGGRAMLAMRALNAQGYTHVYNLVNTNQAASESGRPIVID